MLKRLLKSTFLFSVIGILSCGNTNKGSEEIELLSFQNKEASQKEIIPAANRTEVYLPLLKNKNVAVVGNQTSIINNANGGYTHLVDSLLKSNIRVKKVFAPEHGFRGNADAGEHIKNGIDSRSGLPIISLYGDHKKPTSEDLKDIEIMVFDIQDVGVRFYTYISTLHYIMEACAENNIPLLVLDRPNPNAQYIDGPMLEKEHQSFVGMHPVPVVYGMSIGEYAKMINGEGWLKNGIQSRLEVIENSNYDHSKTYSLPVKPSPNLPNSKAVNLYPSLCFFEGTNVNAGRGTNMQFQVFGSPSLDPDHFDYSYIPRSNEGAKYPKHENTKCYGKDLSETPVLNQINLEWLIEAYNFTTNKDDFFNPFFTKLAGTESLQEQVEKGYTAAEIKNSWKQDLEEFKKLRKKYLIYD